jgi:hypothetical protein
MTAWRRYDAPLLPAFHERFERRWGKGTAPFLDPELHEAPMPRAQWINADTGAALAVVPVWTDDEARRSFAVFYLPPAGDIWLLRPGAPPTLSRCRASTSPCAMTPSKKPSTMPWPSSTVPKIVDPLGRVGSASPFQKYRPHTSTGIILQRRLFKIDLACGRVELSQSFLSWRVP